MLHSLKIRNYILIQELEIYPHSGFNVLTGETGAGKSILLGALGLLLGKRADTNTLLSEDKKCVIEGTFQNLSTKVISLLENEELNDGHECIIRREILPSGKSRAFINDTPVTLPLLKELSSFLIDIHSQHETLLLKNNSFQLNIIDSFAQSKSVLEAYTSSFQDYKKAFKKLEDLKARSAEDQKDTDFKKFLLEELRTAQLNPDQDTDIETELEIVENTELIKENLTKTHKAFEEEEYGINNALATVKSLLDQLISFGKPYADLKGRVESSYLELQDLEQDILHLNDSLEYDLERAHYLKSRIDLLQKLYHKHQVDTVEALIEIQLKLEQELSAFENIDEEISALEQLVAELHQNALEQGEILSKQRSKSFPDLCSKIQKLLSELGMEQATFEIKQETVALQNNGIDQIEMLFSANKGIAPQPIHAVASGGEFSRLMFALKFILSDSSMLPTIIFDEIDSGISGEISIKMGKLMQQMSKHHQLLVITHQPQIAAKGIKNFKVYKDHTEAQTISQVSELSDHERLAEIAGMLAGKNPSEAALNNARELLGLPIE